MDRREKIFRDALDTFGPKMMSLQMSTLLTQASKMLLQATIYPESIGEYDPHLRTADVGLVAHFMAGSYCPDVKIYDAAVMLRLDNLERWIKSTRLKV